MSEEKIYAGNGKVVETKFGKMLKLSFSKEDLEKLTANLNERGWVNCDVKKKKEIVEGKPSHYLQIDTWKPTEQGAPQPASASNDNQEDDLPF